MRPSLPGVLVAVLALGAGAAACGVSPDAGKSATAPTPPRAVSHEPTRATVTTKAPPVAPVSPTSPPPGHCSSVPVSVTAAVGNDPAPVCLVSGTALTVTFDKSYAAIGVPGPWGEPAVQVSPPILQIRSTSSRGSLLVAQLTAVTPGAATVMAGFDQECAAGTSTPCTIPPQVLLTLSVTVVSPQS